MIINHVIIKASLVKGLCKENNFPKSDITMEVGGWVQVSLGFVCL